MMRLRMNFLALLNLASEVNNFDPLGIIPEQLYRINNIENINNFLNWIFTIKYLFQDYLSLFHCENHSLI